MGNLYEKFETDSDAEKTGVWVDMGDGIHLKVARFGNDAHTALMKNLRKPYEARERAGGEMTTEEATAMTIHAMAATILVDWKGVTDRDGNDLKHNIKNAIKLLEDLPDFRNHVALIAAERETYRVAGLQAAVKNSGKPSAGGRSTAKT